MAYSQFLTVALEAVKAAESVINQYYTPQTRATLKPDQSPVTIADQEAELIIRSHVLEYFPNHAILGEESGQSSTDSEYLWIIDPIDGTKNYIRQIPLFATQLALMKDGEVIVGVSNAPAMQELLYAQKGQGAFLNDQPVHVSTVDRLNEAFLSYGSLTCFQKRNALDALLQLENATRGHRGFGDAWAYHLLAQGKVDVVVESAIKIWDVAAASLIVQEAGGQVTDLRGQPLTLATTSLIATNQSLHPVVQEIFS